METNWAVGFLLLYQIFGKFGWNRDGMFRSRADEVPEKRLASKGGPL